MDGTPNWKRMRTDKRFRENMAKRAAVVRAIREFFASRGFIEAETPFLVRHPGMEPNLSPMPAVFADERGKIERGGLITSPEYSLKKLLAGGTERVFELARCFRGGEPFGGTHNPEFTMLEWYRAGADYRDIMRDTEEMAAAAAVAACGTTSVTYGGKHYDLAPPWDRMTVADAFQKYCGLDLGRAVTDVEWFRAAARERGCEVPADERFEDVFFRLFLRDIEPKLGIEKPVFLYDYPAPMAALARLKGGDPRYAERFEAYCAGMELCNAFSELTDAAEQRRRLVAEQEERRAAGKEVFGIDEEFVEAVGMLPECAGIAFGVDRLVMLLADASSIDDVLFFPARDIWRVGTGVSVSGT